MHQFQDRNRESFLEDVDGVDGEPARVLAPGVAVVRLQGLDGDDFSVRIEARCVDVVVGKVAAAVVGVIADEDISRTPVVLIEILEPPSHGQWRDKEQLRNADRDRSESSMAVDDRCVAFVRLIDDRR